MIFKKFQKFLLVPFLILVILGPILSPFAQGLSLPDRYDLVAILVEQGLYAQSQDYDGLVAAAGSNALQRTTLKARIDRYAIDLQTDLPGTRVLIIQADRFEKPENIAAVLERLYVHGDPKEPNRVAYLKGVVIIGEVPLPVVNKKGTRFISLFPYTDFEQKAYIWNAVTRDFELSTENSLPQPEIWHGVIRPPVSTQTEAGKKLLASYFDKNHFFHMGDPRYAQFSKRVFFQDFFHERKNLNPLAYKNYLKFLEHQGEVAYLRYTKKLFQDLSKNFDTELIQEKPENQDMPDIMTKIGKMSDNFMFHFDQLFTKYPSLLNDLMRYTGRYLTSTDTDEILDVDSPINLIAAKDRYTLGYLRAVNTMVENKIDEFVNRLQKNISFATVKIEVDGVAKKTPSGTSQVPLITLKREAPEFVNFTPAVLHRGKNFPNRLNGVSLVNVNNVAQCSPYRGSKGIGPYSKLVETNRALNLETAQDTREDKRTGRTQEEKEQNYQCQRNFGSPDCEGFKHFAGCFYDGSKLFEEPAGAQICFPEHATDPIFDPAGTREIRGTIPANFDNFKSCLGFHEKNQYLQYIKSVDDRMADLAQDYSRDRRQKLERIQRLPLVEKDKNPDQILIAQSRNPLDTFTIKLSDVLRGLGWDAAQNPVAWEQILSTLLSQSTSPQLTTINLSHEKIANVRLKITKTEEKQISSVFYHKEPTRETLEAQIKNLFSKDLPVDQPRYVTFQDSSGAVRRITYPDIFSAGSYDEFFNNLRMLEAELNIIPRDQSLPAPCSNCLTNLFSILTEVSTTDATRELMMSRANQAKTLDALNWRNMDIDAKHNYLNQYYLDVSKNPYVGKSASGYEFLYMNGEGTQDHYEFSMNVDVPEEKDSAFASGQISARALTREKDEDYTIDPGNPFDRPPPQKTSGGGYDLFSWSPPPVSPWWEKMKEWGSKLKQTTDQFSFSKPAQEFYGSLREKNKKQLEEIQKESAAIRDNRRDPEKLDFSRVAIIELSTDSPVMALGKKIDVRLTLKDRVGKIVEDEFTKLTLTIENGRFEAELQDENPVEPGHQITMMSGKKIIGLSASTFGNLKLKASIQNSQKNAEIVLRVISSAKLLLQTQTLAVSADGNSAVAIEVFVKDASDQIIPGASGRIKLKLSDPLMGRLSSEEILLTNGRGNFRFIAGKKKGLVTIQATSQNFDPAIFSLQLLPGPPVRLGLSSSSKSLLALPGSSVPISATLYDAYGNRVDSNSSRRITFRLTESTKAFANLSTQEEQVRNGVATVNLTPREKTGTVNIIAESSGLASAALSLPSVSQFGSREVGEMQLETLSAALLGIPAGDVTRENNLGSKMLVNGKVQALTTLTASAKTYKKIVQINEHGGFQFEDPSRVRAKFIPSLSGAFTVLLSDTKLQTDFAHVRLIPARGGVVTMTNREDIEKLSDGIYMKNLVTGGPYVFEQTDGLRITKAGSVKITVKENGIMISDNDFSLRPIEGNYFTLQVLDRATPVAEIFLLQRFHQDVSLIQEGSPVSAPGVYVETLAAPLTLAAELWLSGNSSNSPRGIVFFDKTEEVRGTQAPGFSFQSLEKSLARFGVGFTEDNKFALLFSGGEMFGEANRPYASDIGIVLGDPTIRLKQTQQGNFTQDIGRLLYAGGSEITGLINLDYNSDGFEDILIVQGNGKIRLIQNNGGYDQLKDQGFILDIKNGIQDITKVDVNNDGQMDLVIAGKVSCRKGESCLDIYENQRGSFVRRNLRIEEVGEKQAILTIRAEDLNRDGYADLVYADASGDIKVLYNRRGQLDSRPRLIGNVGLKIDPAKNLVSSVLLHYPGMVTKNSNDPQSVQMYQTLSVQEANPAATAQGFSNFFAQGQGAPQVTLDQAKKFVERDFIYADLDIGAFSNSTKFAEDLNGGVVQGGDRIRYTITLRNDSAALKRSVTVSDVIADQIEIDQASLRCLDCGRDEFLVETFSGDPSRPFLFKNIAIPSRASRRVVYEGIFKGTASAADRVKLTFSNNFSDANSALQASLRGGLYPSIAVSKEGNPTQRVRYFYSTGIDSNGVLSWSSALSSPPVPESPASFKAKTGLEVPTAADLNPQSGVSSPLAQKKLKDLQKNVLEEINEKLDDIASGTKKVISKLTCDAGCIALPTNAALFAPGPYSLLGTPGPFDIGLAAIGISPLPPWVNVFSPGLVSPILRFYVSPTLTGGVGFGLCLGPYGTAKNCFSFGVNPIDLLAPGVCKKINGAVSGALASANDAISKLNEGVTITLGSNQGTTGAGGRTASGSGLGNYSLGNYESPVRKSRNVRVPGFPSVITDWASRQWEEVIDKIRFPDLYVIFPDPNSIGSAFVPSKEFSRTGDVLTNVLSFVNSIPLIDIETREVLFKIPFITRKEIEQVKADIDQWMEDEELEFDKWRNLMGCAAAIDKALGTGISTGENFSNAELCRFVTLEMNKLITTLLENVKALDEWILFPKKILQFRAIESYYLGQIIDYLDTIIEFTGGWVKRNTAQVKAWRRAVRQVKDAINSYKALFQLMIDYNESCDRCRTERFTLKELILKLFIAIPAPPVIPLPKLPDLILDVSKIQAGLRVEWPDVKFKLEPLLLPKIPRISLGVNLDIPTFKLLLPPIPQIPKPPELPELPALPPLNLPRLPDIPPPPTIPGLPSQLQGVIDILKKIVKILCLIRLGLIPTDEILLKPRIEEITARPLFPVLPIDLLLTIQSPTISVTYIDQLKATGFTNLQFDLSYVLEKAKEFAVKANAFSTGLSKGINKYSDTLFKQLEKITSPTLNIGPDGVKLNYLESKEQITKKLSEALGSDASELMEYGIRMQKLIKSLAQESENREQLFSKIPSSFTLTPETIAYASKKLPRAAMNVDLTVPPFLAKLQAYRDHLVAALNERKNFLSDSSITDELKDFSRYVANERSPFLNSSLKRYVASVPGKGSLSMMYDQKSKGPSKVGPLDFEKVEWLPDEHEKYQDTGRLIAQVPPAPPPASSPSPPAPTIQDMGIFTIDENGQSKRLINYTLEASKSSKLADIDLDNDGDSEKLYSYGNNVFVKKNHRRRDQERRVTFRPVDIEFWTIFELLPKAASPSLPKVVSETARSTSFTFTKPDMENLAGYEIIAKNSPFFFENPVQHESLRIHLFPDSPTGFALIRNISGTAFFLDSGGGVKGPVTAGTMLNFDDRIRVQNGSITVNYKNGGDTVMRANETYLLKKIENMDQPTVSFDIDPAFYFARVYAFDKNGNRSNASEKLLLAPQICGDTSSPIANFGKTHFTLPVGKTMNLDAKRSFDSFSKISSYALDTDTENNTNPLIESSSPTFTIGPYTEVGQKKMRLIVRDEALNEGYQDITVDIVTPKIVLDAIALRSNAIAGYVEPLEEKVPLTIARLRPGTSSPGWEILKTPSVDSKGQYSTDANGKFRITDFDLRDRTVIRNHEGKIVAEISNKTGRITVLDTRYETRASPAESDGKPTRIGLFLKSDVSLSHPLTFVYFVPDVNTDTTLDGPTVLYNAASREKMNGTHVKPLPQALAQGFTFQILPGDDREFTGATALFQRGQNKAIIQTNGDIFLRDPALSLREKPLAISGNREIFQQIRDSEPIIFELLSGQQTIAEIFIAAHTGPRQSIEIIENFANVSQPKSIARPSQPFRDIPAQDTIASTIERLYRHGIVAGYPSSIKGELLFKPENKINRAEFTQITLKMLCILPRPEAHTLPSPFYDVLNEKFWFYPALKEGNIRGFIRGYLAEQKIDTRTGFAQTPFKPANDITLAEALTVVLAALHEEGIIDLSRAHLKPLPNGPWYDPYISIAQDLKPFLRNSSKTEGTFLITSTEAATPDKKISRRDFATIADRVLLIHDCYKGMKKKESEVKPPAESKKLSLQAGLERKRNEEGIFVLRPLCRDVCPCRATIGPGQDLQPGDIIFAAITGSGGVPIYAKSNEEKF